MKQQQDVGSVKHLLVGEMALVQLSGQIQLLPEAEECYSMEIVI